LKWAVEMLDYSGAMILIFQMPVLDLLEVANYKILVILSGIPAIATL